MKLVRSYLYIIFLLFFTLFSYAFIDPNFIYLKFFYTGLHLNYRLFVTILFEICILVFFAYYLYFLRLAIKNSLSYKHLFKLVLISCGVLLLAYPAMLSFDIFNYIASAKVLYFYHENPYIIMPNEFLGDPLLLFMHASNKIALYGPVWILLTVVPFIFGFTNFIVTLFSFKLFVLIFFIAFVYYLWEKTKSIFSVVFFALNPLVLIETIVSGHNDIVMIFFAVLSLDFLFKRKYGWAVFLLLMSVLIKYATVFLIPIFLYTFWIHLKHKKIDVEKMYKIAAILMLCVFFLAPIREEIYPWYAIWFLGLLSFTKAPRYYFYIAVIFSLSLMMRYIPYMLLGTYFGQTPFIKIAVTFFPVLIATFIFIVKKKVWQKKVL